MNLFGFFKRKKDVKFTITEPDREWIEGNIKWLVQVYGYPKKQSEQIELSEKFLPKTFRAKSVNVQHIIDDLALLLKLDEDKISFEFQEDLRDIAGVPFEIEGVPFESETVLAKNAYKIYIAKSLLQSPKRLIYRLVGELTKIRLSESKLEFDTGEDTDLFINLASVYFGFGIIISQHLVDRGRASDGFWETKWNHVSEMPMEVMAFILATYSKLLGQDDPEWKNKLPQDIMLLFEKAIEYLKESPSSLFNKSESSASNLQNKAELEYQNNDFEAGISTLKKILFLTTNELLKAEVYNNIGYYQIRNGDFEKSIINFKKALEIDPDYGFAYDNLGYTLIKTGNFEGGKRNIEQAFKTGNNDKAYSYRNIALYYQAVGDFVLAEKNFQLAFEHEEAPVDLLEFHYGDFLLEQGQINKGLEYLQKAVVKGEPEAIKRMDHLRQ